MTEDDDKGPAWVADLGAFGTFTLVSAVLEGVGIGLIFWQVYGGGWPVAIPWMWVFCFPSMAAHSLGFDDVARGLLWLNPLIYGAMWWFAWEMFRLMRAKPREVESPPEHRE
jgi:hypothetical protein